MKDVQMITYKGQQIVQVDLADCKPEESIALIPKAKELVASQPLASVRILMIVTNASYNKAAADTVKDFVRHNSPYVKASAVVGADGVRMVLLTTVSMLAKRDIKAFNAIEDAKEWLVSVK